MASTIGTFRGVLFKGAIGSIRVLRRLTERIGNTRCWSIFPAVIAAFLFAAPALPSTIFEITVNTSSIASQSGIVDLQFNPGGATAQDATATIVAFTGATLGDVVPPLLGPVSGTLPHENVTFKNSAYTDYAQELLFGNALYIRVAFDGVALTAPDNGPAGTSFFLFFYNQAFDPLVTADGLVAQIDINPDGSVSAGGADNVTFTTVSQVPEPSTVSSLLIAAGAAALVRHKRTSRR